MSEPKWLADTDLARCRSTQGAEAAAAWATWAIGLLPPKLRNAAARAWAKGETPAGAADELRAAGDDGEMMT